MFLFRLCRPIALGVSLLVCSGSAAFAQKGGAKAITAKDLRMHLSIVASDETEGRGTPSTGSNIVARYLATMAGHAGLKPIMPDGSFFQDIPLNVATVSESRSRLLVKGASESVFYIQKDFGGSFGRTGKIEGDVLFVGAGLQASKIGWDDFAKLDMKGKVVVALDGQLPAGHESKDNAVRIASLMAPMMSGAAAIFTVISPEREREIEARGAGLTANPFITLQQNYPTNSSAGLADSEKFSADIEKRIPMRAAIRHAVAAAMLGVTRDELNAMFASLAEGRQVPGREVPLRVELTVETDPHQDRARNVLAVAEGSDPKLKSEYVVISAHYDHLGIRNGRSMNGADDNGSGTVALLEIAQALAIERPKRSVILAWFSGEELGLWGSHHFVNNSPVPIGSISANINLDMIGRNDPNTVYVIASNSLSTELYNVLKTVSGQPFGLKLDYTYDDKYQSEHFYSRSDHYPFIRMGVPAVTFFTGKTPEYHQAEDTIDKVDFAKMEKIARLAYAAALEIGNRPELLKLDVDPKVTARGKQNIEVQSIR
jgi:hypothetical protein